jgi:hypothetical protein
MRARDCLKTLRGWRDEVNNRFLTEQDQLNNACLLFSCIQSSQLITIHPYLKSNELLQVRKYLFCI